MKGDTAASATTQRRSSSTERARAGCSPTASRQLRRRVRDQRLRHRARGDQLQRGARVRRFRDLRRVDRRHARKSFAWFTTGRRGTAGGSSSRTPNSAKTHIRVADNELIDNRIAGDEGPSDGLFLTNSDHVKIVGNQSNVNAGSGYHANQSSDPTSSRTTSRGATTPASCSTRATATAARETTSRSRPAESQPELDTATWTA